MKKSMLYVIAAVMIFTLLAGCSAGPAPTEPASTPTDPTAPSGETTSPTQAPTTEPTAPSEETTVPTEEPTEPATEATLPGSVPEGAEIREDGTYLFTEALDSEGNPAEEENSVSSRITVYNTDGNPVSQETVLTGSGQLSSVQTWAYSPDGAPDGSTYTEYHDGVLRFYEERYPNGNPKSYKAWNANGVLSREFISFHGENNNNGIVSQYDDQGNLTYRDTFGNPDGSLDTYESWDAHGTYYMSKVRDGITLEAYYTDIDGGSVQEIYDYDAETVHVITKRPNNTADTVMSMETGEILSGYIESTMEDGTYHYTEYADGCKYKVISDGYANPLGFVYRSTTTYYPNGQPRTVEEYYYYDGGRTYAEFDESGNLTHSEDTTECNYGVFG